MKLIILLVLCSFALAEKARYDNYRVYKIEVDNEDQMELMRQIEAFPDGYRFWHEPTEVGKHVELVVPPHKFAEFGEFIEKFELKTEKLISNLQEVYDKEEKDSLRRTSKFSRSAKSSKGWTAYWTYQEISDWLDELAAEHSDKVTLINYGKSFQNRDLKGVKINVGGGTKKAVVIEGVMHAREWISGATTTWILNELLTSEDPEVQEMASSFEWYIFPVTNPDGYAYTWTNDRSWRKTRQPTNLLCIGADPNRNWDNNFGGGGTSTNPCSDTYPGTAPFSEPETRQLSDYLKTLNILGYYSFHAYGQMIMTPYGWTKELPADYELMRSIGEAGRTALQAKYGTAYALGSIANVIYIASGSSADWVHAELKPTFAYAYEFRDTGRYGFSLPVDQIIPNSIEIFASVVAMLKEVKARGLA